ncbi:unnamed protein product, partial [Cylicocyclus nassatus]
NFATGKIEAQAAPLKLRVNFSQIIVSARLRRCFLRLIQSLLHTSNSCCECLVLRNFSEQHLRRSTRLQIRYMRLCCCWAKLKNHLTSKN